MGRPGLRRPSAQPAVASPSGRRLDARTLDDARRRPQTPASAATVGASAAAPDTHRGLHPASRTRTPANTHGRRRLRRGWSSRRPHPRRAKPNEAAAQSSLPLPGFATTAPAPAAPPPAAPPPTRLPPRGPARWPARPGAGPDAGGRWEGGLCLARGAPGGQLRFGLLAILIAAGRDSSSLRLVAGRTEEP